MTAKVRNSTPFTGEVDVYNRQERLKIGYQKLEDADILPENKKLIKDFIYFKKEDKAPSPLRQIKYLQLLTEYARYAKKPLNKIDAKDIVALVKTINSRLVRRGGNMDDYKGNHEATASTKETNIKVLKSFLRWVHNDVKVKELFLKVPNPKVIVRKKDPRKLITWNDAVLISQHTMSMRDKTLVQFMRDSGCRPEEVLTLKVGDIETKYNGRGVVFHIRKSKTPAGIRSPALRRCGKQLLDYLNTAHPYAENKEAVLFCKGDGSPLTQTMVAKILSQAIERSGLDKYTVPKMLRAASISHMSQKYPDAFVKAYHGHEPDTRVLKNYQFTDVDKMNEELLRDSGVLPANETTLEKDVTDLKCQWCNEINAAGLTTCIKCGRSLDPDENARDIEKMAAVDEHCKIEAKRRGIPEAQIFSSLIQLALDHRETTKG